MNVNLVLPWPPSVNRIWRAYNGRVVMSDHARAYKQEAGHIARSKCDQPTLRPVAVTMWLHGPATGDIDNRVKAVLDALNGIVYSDDRQVSELHVYRRRCLDARARRVEVSIVTL